MRSSLSHVHWGSCSGGSFHTMSAGHLPLCTWTLHQTHTNDPLLYLVSNSVMHFKAVVKSVNVPIYCHALAKSK